MCEVKYGFPYGRIITPVSCAQFTQYQCFKDTNIPQTNTKKIPSTPMSGADSNLSLTEENLSLINHLSRSDKKQRINQWKQNNLMKEKLYPHPFIYECN